MNNLKEIFEFNSSNSGGCIDVIVSQAECGCLKYSEFHLLISKFQMMYNREKNIQIFINSKQAKYSMKVSRKGYGYFEKFTVGDSETGTKEFENELKEKTTKVKIGDYDVPPEDSNSNHTSIFANGHKLPSLDNFRVFIPNKFTQNADLNKVSNTQLEDLMKNNKKIKMSLCGNLFTDESTIEEINKIFEANLINYNSFLSDPQGVLSNKNLMFKINGNIYDAYFGIPQIISQFAFNAELDEKTMRELQNITVTEFRPHMFESQRKKFNLKLKKSFKPPSDFFETIDLIPGLNILEYKFVGNFNKNYVISSRLYFYPYQSQNRILISDIDGTITRSDILGHVMPFVYQDWSQMGIAELYSHLFDRGYIIIYLSSRNIGLSNRTIKYLESVNQKGYKLPPGPVILSSDSMIASLKREMILKNPETFKIGILRDIKKIFSHSLNNPLYAGFGNKDTDAVSYMVVGIPKKRIFTINCEGEIYVLKSDKILSYTHLHQNINQIFPDCKLVKLPFTSSEVQVRRFSYYNHNCKIPN
jgi:phosphatidate phosphatase PAH1